MVPEKDTALYGFGSVAWKDRMEEWKRKQSNKLQVVKHQRSKDDKEDLQMNEMDSDLPM